MQEKFAGSKSILACFNCVQHVVNGVVMLCAT
jgi:hypothetical protein